MKNKTSITNLTRLCVCVSLAGVLSTLFLDMFFWGTTWLMEQPFDKLGWFRITYDMANFNGCTIRIDYVMRLLFIFLVNIMHLGIFSVFFVVLNAR